MKKILLSMIALCCMTVARAQMSEQVNAILQVGDEVTVFYGAGALANALTAAPESGAVITLSSGLFNAVTITKRVTIYGCGWFTDTENGIYPSTLNGTLTINLPEELEAPHDVYVEGLYINGDVNVPSFIDGLSVVKCSWNSTSFSKENKRVNLIQSYIRGRNFSGADNVILKNSYVNVRYIFPFSAESTVLLDHCILTDGYDFDNGSSRFNCTNCVITASYCSSGGPKIFQYCVFPGGSWAQTTGSGNCWFNVNMATFYTDAENNDYGDNRTFTLAAPEDYIGSDGTEVGVNGGDYPWNKQPKTPVVKDLKLKVEGKQLKVTYDAQVR